MELTAGAPSDQSWWLIFGDLNRFKALNDEHGHGAGDAAIAHVGRHLRDLAESLKGLAFRKSGDEFVVLLTEGMLEGFAAESHLFDDAQFPWDSGQLGVSTSFGAAPFDGESTALEVQDRAELALQHAKAEGDGKLLRWSSALGPLGERQRSRCECGFKYDVTWVGKAEPWSCPQCGDKIRDRSGYAANSAAAGTASGTGGSFP